MKTTDKRPKLPENPLCINVNRFRYYLLAPDEAVLFDWLIVKQVSFKYIDFHYSQLRIEKETRIKRTRLETILDRFLCDGFLETEVRTNPTTKGQVRYFKVCLCLLANELLLRKYIKPGSELMDKFMAYLTFHACKQQLAWLKEAELYEEEELQPQELRRRSEKLKPYYNQIYQGYLHYRDLLLAKPDSSRELLRLFRQEKLPMTIDHLPVFTLLVQNYSSMEIGNIVQNYLSDIYHEKIRPTNLITTLLLYRPTERLFPVADVYVKRQLSSRAFLEIIRERPLGDDKDISSGEYPD